MRNKARPSESEGLLAIVFLPGLRRQRSGPASLRLGVERRGPRGERYALTKAKQRVPARRGRATRHFGCQRGGCDRISLRRASLRRKIAPNRPGIRGMSAKTGRESCTWQARPASEGFRARPKRVASQPADVLRGSTDEPSAALNQPTEPSHGSSRDNVVASLKRGISYSRNRCHCSRVRWISWLGSRDLGHPRLSSGRRGTGRFHGEDKR